MSLRLRTAQRYETILEVNQAAITQRALNEMFRGMCRAVKKVIPYDRAGLSLYAPEKGALKLAASDGCDPDSFYRVGLALDCKESHHGWVFQHQKPIVRRDLQRELEFQVEQQNVVEGIRSYCAVPLIVRRESIGVLIVLSSQKNRYSEGHAEFLQEVSDQVVLAVAALMPLCPTHPHTKLLCPRCIASGGGQTTVARYKEQLSEWGKKGGRGRKKLAGGLTKDVLG
jgi:formate hydrogenlyase transcriptional activator